MPRPAHRRPPEQAQDARGAVHGPAQAQRHGLAGGEPHAREILAGKPALPPVIDDLGFADGELDAARGVGQELVDAADRWREGAAPVDGLSLRRHRDVAGLRVGRGRVEPDGVGQRNRFGELAEARERGVVPEDAVTAARDQERNEDLGVVLVEIQVGVGEIDQIELVLAEAVERLAACALPTLGHRERRLAPAQPLLHLVPAVALGEDRLRRRSRLRVVERHRPLGQGDAHDERGGGDALAGGLVGDRERRRHAALAGGGQRRARKERRIARVGDTHDVVGAHADLEEAVADRQHRPRHRRRVGHHQRRSGGARGGRARRRTDGGRRPARASDRQRPQQRQRGSQRPFHHPRPARH